MAKQSRVETKTDRALEDRMLSFAGDAERVEVLQRARSFKRSWIELAEALTTVAERGSWQRWGHGDFDTYCKSELHLTPATAAKLLGSFRFLKKSAPRIIERVRSEPSAPVPSLRAVDFVARAADRGAADGKAMSEIRRAAFDEGMELPMLSRRYREVAFPVAEADQDQRVRAQIVSTARRLASLLASDESPVPRKLAARLEETLGELLEALDAEPN